MESQAQKNWAPPLARSSAEPLATQLIRSQKTMLRIVGDGHWRLAFGQGGLFEFDFDFGH
jgi:hypothetical protein